PNYGEDIDDLGLLNVDEVLRRIHQEVHLIEQEGGVGKQRVNVAHDFPAVLLNLGTAAYLPQHEGQGALGIHQAQPDLTVGIFQGGQLVDGVFQLGFFI